MLRQPSKCRNACSVENGYCRAVQTTGYQVRLGRLQAVVRKLVQRFRYERQWFTVLLDEFIKARNHRHCTHPKHHDLMHAVEQEPFHYGDRPAPLPRGSLAGNQRHFVLSCQLSIVEPLDTVGYRAKLWVAAPYGADLPV